MPTLLQSQYFVILVYRFRKRMNEVCRKKKAKKQISRTIYVRRIKCGQRWTDNMSKKHSVLEQTLDISWAKKLMTWVTAKSARRLWVATTSRQVYFCFFFVLLQWWFSLPCHIFCLSVNIVNKTMLRGAGKVEGKGFLGVNGGEKHDMDPHFTYSTDRDERGLRGGKIHIRWMTFLQAQIKRRYAWRVGRYQYNPTRAVKIEATMA